jgi:hypothetical protein
MYGEVRVNSTKSGARGDETDYLSLLGRALKIVLEFDTMRARDRQIPQFASDDYNAYLVFHCILPLPCHSHECAIKRRTHLGLQL